MEEVMGATAKTIRKVIKRKIDDWLDSIDEPVRSQVKNKIIVTGGCITSLLLGENPNDYDVYLEDHDATLALAKYYVNKFDNSNLEVTDEGGRIKIVIPSDGIAVAEGEVITEGEDGEVSEKYEDLEKEALATEETGSQKYRPIFLSSNAITLANKIQIVIRFYGTPDDIHKNFDFQHTKNLWASKNNELILNPEALASILAKNLVYTGSLYPVCSVARLKKFVQRGWKINAGQILKICMQISALDLTDVDTLENQLTGVDTAYFLQVIRLLRDKDPHKVDTAYLVTILDRMF
jgi:hypothetical protein